MILSTEKKFIFIHVPKAAGTSVHGALSHLDIFHGVRRGDAAARETCAAAHDLPAGVAAFTQHTTAGAAIQVLGREVYESYYTFCFVRNPWDVAVSWFHYRLYNPQIDGHAEAGAAGAFEDYVRKVLAGPDGARRVGLQYPYVTDAEGSLAMTFVGRHESLAGDFAAVTAALDLETLPLDHFNQSYHAPWPSLYTPETFAIVAGLVARDAALFGYTADPAAYGIV
ncbi:MAG: sulfotransferase family 2 domain-containing protein [Rhodospirillaceae bacterium]|nr:sulfotransferase family 2 domain-containing protein [Rhodospirillaceae bacterium]